ncbi:MAG: hypothetical protein Q4E02_02470 [Lagierella massiliensis]|nr:hypothetical protein [Lagierella massiliensis]
MKVGNYQDLIQALDSEESTIELINSISSPFPIKLTEGKRIIGDNKNIFLSFIGTDGIGLTKDNEISNISIQTSQNKRAIFINSDEEDLGNLVLKNLTVTGMVQLLTRGKNKRTKILIDKLDIVSADTRIYPERPMKYGVNVYQGALTVYNFSPDKESLIEADINRVSIGRENAPVIGSGLFVSGFNDDTGKVIVNNLVTHDIFSNGMIPTGQPNLITGAIFIVYGALAKNIKSNGVVKTYGTNDMVLDVWGEVENWTVHGEVESYGPSAIGFVNFGTVKNFDSYADIKTYGPGARGFNQYDGTIEKARFKNIKTVGDGSIGMQFSKPVGEIIIDENVVTEGSVGETLVKGVIKTLNADAISVLEDGVIERLEIGGDLITKGENVVSLHIDKGEVKQLRLKGKIQASNKSKEVSIENNGLVDTSNIERYLN